MGVRELWSKWFSAEKTPENEKQTKRGKKRIYNRLKKVRTYNVDLEMDTLGQAIESARDIENPDFDDLYSIYNQIKKDRHLKSQVETAINDIQQSPFVVKVEGNESEDLKELFDTEWFDNLVYYMSDAEFWCHSLVEMPELNEGQEYDGCFLIPRENVNPAKKRIVLDKDGDVFLPYDNKQKSLNLIEIFSKEELGLYEFLSEEVILKKYARTDWSQSSERYGMPFLKYATDTEDPKELDKIEDMCANFATNGYIMCGTDDDIEIVQANKGDFYKIYMEAIQQSNEELSKAVNGQTATGDAQSYVGTAEMHERIKNTFTKARLRRVQHHINGKLIPLMIENGYKLADQLAKAKFQYVDLLDDSKQLATEQEEDPNDPDGNNSEDGKEGGNAQNLVKKKPGQSPGSPRLDLSRLVNVLDLDKWLKRFFEGGTDKVDKEAWGETYQQLGKAVSSGTGIDLAKTRFDSPDFELVTQLQQNAAVFAAFKNHDEQETLRSLLVDPETKKPRSFNEWKKLAAPITQRYNKEWLLTEFKQAEANAQMARKWNGFQENADLYPNLRYDHSGNPDGRPEHIRLDGLVLPLDDPRLRKIYPPNGWGCGCDMTQTDEPVNIVEGLEGFEPDKGFDFNPGIDKKLFSGSAGYYQSAKNKKEITTIGELMLMRSSRNTGLGQAGSVFKAKGLGNVKVTKKGIKEALNQPHKDLFVKNSAIANLKGLLSDLEWKTLPDWKNNPMVKQYHYAEIDLNGKKSYVVVREMVDKEKLFYTITDQLKKK